MGKIPIHKRYASVALLCGASALSSFGCTRVDWKGQYFSKLESPEVSLASMPPLVRGGAQKKVSFEIRTADALRVTRLIVQLSQDGGKTWKDVDQLAPDSRSFVWKTPAGEYPSVMIQIVAQDNRGNRGTVVSNAFKIRTALPALTLESPKEPVKSKESSLEFAGKCETGLPVELQIDGTLASSTSCKGGAWSFRAQGTKEGIQVYRFSQNAGDGLETSVQQSWTRDVTPPKITSIKQRWETLGSKKAFIAYLSFLAKDNISVVAYCYAQNAPLDDAGKPTPPEPTSSCWQGLKADSSDPTAAGLSDLALPIDYSDRNKPIFVWVKDEVDLISEPASPDKQTCVPWQGPPQVMAGNAGNTYQWIVTNSSEYSKVTFKFGSDAAQDLSDDSVILKTITADLKTNLIVSAYDSCDVAQIKTLPLDLRYNPGAPPAPTPSPTPSPSPSPSPICGPTSTPGPSTPPAPVAQNLPAPGSPYPPAKLCDSASPRIEGDCNGDEHIDNRSIDEVGRLADPATPGVRTKCAAGLTAWEFDYYSAGRRRWTSSSGQPGYKCSRVKCIPSGGYTLDSYGENCCSKKVDSNARCVD